MSQKNLEDSKRVTMALSIKVSYEIKWWVKPLVWVLFIKNKIFFTETSEKTADWIARHGFIIEVNKNGN